MKTCLFGQILALLQALEAALMSEWESKMDAIVDETIHENITSLVGVPSWMLLLLNRVLEKTGKDTYFRSLAKLRSLFSWGRQF